MRILKAISLFIMLATFLNTVPSFSLTAKDEETAIKLSNKVIGNYLGEYTLIDQDGKNFRLKEFLGKPLLISFIYTSCGHICPTITMNLKKAIKEAGRDFGVKFNAIIIGFDVENDTPQRMKEYGSNFTDDFKNWRFAAANKETIDKLAKDIGFYYRKVEGGFDHLNFVTVVDKDGKIYKQVYGMDFKPQDILQPVYQSLSPQKSGFIAQPSGIIGKLLLFCYKYDEATGTYKLDYGMLIPMIIGPIFSIGVMISLIIYLFRGSEIKGKAIKPH
ncbi:MAG: SCO family protein [Deltaproteobacteria bacterium]|nr:SCO family protein [Deltaproteobacteria bacterium]